MNESTKRYTGSCHCGAVRFEYEADLTKGASRCNCSICTKVAQLGSVGKPEALRVLSREAETTGYAWGSKMATRRFCKHCGVHCFSSGHLPELGGDFVSVNLNCLDGVELSALPVVYWDGRHDNWDRGPRAEPWPILAAASAG